MIPRDRCRCAQIMAATRMKMPNAAKTPVKTVSIIASVREIVILTSALLPRSLLSLTASFWKARQRKPCHPFRYLISQARQRQDSFFGLLASTASRSKSQVKNPSSRMPLRTDQIWLCLSVCASEGLAQAGIADNFSKTESREISNTRISHDPKFGSGRFLFCYP